MNQEPISLVNMKQIFKNAKKFKIMIAICFQYYAKRIIYHTQVGLILKMQTYFNTSKYVNKIFEQRINYLTLRDQ